MIDKHSVKGSTHNVNMDQLMPLIREQLAAGNSVRFSPKGISMLPMLRQGKDSVVLSPITGRLEKYDLPLYQRTDGHYILHRVIRVGETYTCMGDNQFVEEPGLTHDQMIGLVTGFYRGDRHHSVNEPLYRLYCHLWFHTRRIRHFWRRGICFLRRCLK